MIKFYHSKNIAILLIIFLFILQNSENLDAERFKAEINIFNPFQNLFKNKEQFDRAILFDALLDVVIQFENVVKLIGYEKINQIESILIPYSPEFELDSHEKYIMLYKSLFTVFIRNNLDFILEKKSKYLIFIIQT